MLFNVKLINENETYLIGKKVGDIVDGDTKILTKFKDDYDVMKGEFKKGNIIIDSCDDIAVISDFHNHLVLCVKSDKVVALFHVYDIRNVNLNPSKRMVTAVGHETNHQYWFNDGDYDEQHTR